MSQIAPPQIKNIKDKKVVGVNSTMSLSDNKTAQLWKELMPRRKEINNRVSNDYLDIRIYKGLEDFNHFTPQTEFVKWAAVEVSDFDHIPTGFNSFILTGGKYAVFIHKGDISTFHLTMQFIFQEWLPNSEYQLDDRPHFEVLAEDYKLKGVESEEEVWIPVC